MVRDFLTRTALPVAAFLAIAAWSLTQTAEARAETVYLARSALVLLMAAAWVAAPTPRFTRATGAAATLAVLATWALPSGPREGPHRGLVVTVVLLALLAGALANRLTREWRWWSALPLAVAMQAILLPDLLLNHVPWHRLLVQLGALPLLSGLAVALLARWMGPGKALLTGGLTASLAPGFDLGATLLLGALAAAAELRFRRHSTPWRWVAMAFLVTPLLFSPRAGLLALAAASFVLPLRWLKLAAPAVALGLAMLFPVRPMGEALFLLPWVILLAPVILAPSAKSLQARGGAAILGAAGAVFGPDPGWLAPAIALAVLSCDDKAPASRFQAAWGAFLVAGSMLFAGYPWLRSPPLPDLLDRLGVTPSFAWVILLSALGAVLILGESFVPATSKKLIPAGLTLALTTALWLAVPQPGVPVLPESVLLGGESGPRQWSSPVPPFQARSVLVESSLGNAGNLDQGVTVATVTLTTASGALLRLPLRFVSDTDEWSARRLPGESSSPVSPPSSSAGWTPGASSSDSGTDPPWSCHRASPPP